MGEPIWKRRVITLAGVLSEQAERPRVSALHWKEFIPFLSSIFHRIRRRYAQTLRRSLSFHERLLRGSTVSLSARLPDFAFGRSRSMRNLPQDSENFSPAGVTSLLWHGRCPLPHFCRAWSGRKSRTFASYQLEARSRQGDAASSLHLGDQRTTAVAFHHNAGFTPIGAKIRFRLR